MIDEYDFSIYPRRLWVGTDFKEMRKSLKHPGKKKLEELADGADAQTYYQVCDKKENQLGYAVLLDPSMKEKGSTYVINVIAHEAYHVTTMLLGETHMPVDMGDDEHAAYIQGWVTSRIWMTIAKLIYPKKNGRGKKD